MSHAWDILLSSMTLISAQIINIWLTTRELAEIFNISKITIDNCLKSMECKYNVSEKNQIDWVVVCFAAWWS